MPSFGYDSTVIDPRSFDPPSFYEEEHPEDELEHIVDDCRGIYIPQFFCQNYEKTEGVDNEDWEICLSGPDHEHYWEAWDNILSSWETTEEDCNGLVFKITIEQDGALYQRRSFSHKESID